MTNQELREKFYAAYEEQRMGGFTHPKHFIADFRLAEIVAERTALLEGMIRDVLKKQRNTSAYEYIETGEDGRVKRVCTQEEIDGYNMGVRHSAAIISAHLTSKQEKG